MNFWLLGAVAGGGAIGSLARYWMAGALQSPNSPFPYGIMIVNILGGFLMGVVVELGALKLNMSPELRAFLTVGVLGGFTTFSTFSLDTVLLIQRDELANRTGACGAAGVGEDHQREQAGHLGIVGDEAVEQAREPDRLA